MAVEILNGILSKIGEFLVEATIHQAGYLFRFKSNVDDLRTEHETLRLALDRVQHEVERAKRNTEEIEKDVQKWLTDVGNVITDVEKLEEEIRENKTCNSGWCPNFAWRYRLSRKAEKRRSIVLELLESGKFQRVSHRTDLPDIEFSASRDFVTFESTRSTFDQVIEALRDDKISMVGIYGMGGVGKTTLAKEIGKQVQQLNIFSKVVLATVTQTPVLRNIQDQIADSLNLKLDEKSEDGRARRLWMRLKDENKILIILDDVWAKIDLTSIGIPLGDDDQKGCKILLTTRRTHVCTSMGCESNIPLNILKEEEGLALLQKTAGVGDHDLPTLNSLASEVAKECKGLPLAIVTIGSALKGKPIDEWKLSLQKLKNSKFVNVEDADTNVYACLKLSYDYLKDAETKFCFLLCSLYPEDFEIPLEELVIYGTGIGLFKDANSLETARGQVRVTVNNLKASGLLLDASREQFVKMHDIVRDVALWITSTQENKFMSKAGLGLTEWPKVEGLEQYTAISLMYNEIKVLPVGLVCPKLEILLLDVEFDFGGKISDHFFSEMKALKVLSLSLRELSLNSLQLLTNIRSLQLHYCYLKDLYSVGKLSRLEVLSLKGSSFEELPKELGDLDKLRLLNLKDCRQLKRIPSNVLQRLSQLEELYIDEASFSGWKVEGTSNASLYELNSLHKLAILSLYVDENSIPKDFTFPKLQRYEIVVNYRLDYGRIREGGGLQIHDSSSSSPLIAFQALFRNLTDLYLNNLSESRIVWDGCNQQQLSLHGLTTVNVSSCPKLTCLFTISLARSLVQLKKLTVSDCTMMKHIVEEKEGQFAFPGKRNHDDVIVFPQLRELYLRRLNNLIGFCPQNYTLPTLEVLRVIDCDNLSSLFIAEASLKYLSVNNCGQVWDKIQSRLRYDFKNLQRLQIIHCNVKVLFELDVVEREFSLPNLKELRLRDLCEMEALCKGPAHVLSLKNLSSLTVSSCPKLRHLFSTTFTQNLQQLESLHISDCEQLEQIIVGDDDNKECKEIMLQGVEDLSLQNLPSLINLGPDGHHFMFPSLTTLTVTDCPRITASFLVDQNTTAHVQDLYVDNCDQFWDKIQSRLRYDFKNLQRLGIRHCKVKALFELDGVEREFSLPNLKELHLQDLCELEALYKGPAQILSLKNLSTLRVSECPKLKHLFSINFAQNLLRLETLDISDCEQLEQIIVGDDDNKECKEIMLQGVEYLSLQNLPSLVNLGPEGYHFMFPSLTRLIVKDCPKITTSFSIDQNGTVHVQEEDVSARSTTEIWCLSKGQIRGTLPPYMGK